MLKRFLLWCRFFCLFFFFNDTATTEIYTLSLHDALPIFERCAGLLTRFGGHKQAAGLTLEDRKSTRLNSSHPSISYADLCLKKKNIKKKKKEKERKKKKKKKKKKKRKKR